MKAIIAGGGIGGLASALALARHGWEVEVLEQATESAEVGAGRKGGQANRPGGGSSTGGGSLIHGADVRELLPGPLPVVPRWAGGAAD